jgi:ATP synthase protein I
LLRAAYIGELGKIVLTVLLFALVFYMVRPLDALYLFLSFIIVQFSVSLELFFKNID